jgi:hypothetical protein
MDKGKGKERRNSITSAVMDAPTPGGPDGTDEDGKGEKRRKNTYRHLIKGTPGMFRRDLVELQAFDWACSGKHSTKKDDYLVMSVSIPPKPKLVIEEFDQRTQEKTFKMTLEGLKGVGSSYLLGFFIAYLLYSGTSAPLLLRPLRLKRRRGSGYVKTLWHTLLNHTAYMSLLSERGP